MNEEAQCSWQSKHRMESVTPEVRVARSPGPDALGPFYEQPLHAK
jgi:hypothetical protein